MEAFLERDCHLPENTVHVGDGLVAEWLQFSVALPFRIYLLKWHMVICLIGKR